MSLLTRREALRAAAALTISPAILAHCRSVAGAAEPYADAVLVAGEPPKPQPGSFTVAVLPDTQNYSERYPQTFAAQTAWLVENQKARNIAFVTQLGDVTNHNSPEEWTNAQKAIDALDGKLGYSVVPGNHDYSERGGCNDRATRMNEYLPKARFAEMKSFGGCYDREPDKMENSYHLFSAEGKDYLVLGLEFGPRRDVVRWANEVVAQHKDRAAILTTHAYMYYDDTRYDWKKYGTKQTWNPHNYGVAKTTGDDVTDGEELWNELVGRHENFILTLNGHVLNDGLGRTSTRGAGKRDVHQVLVNFQMRPHGGDGWLRLLEFASDGRILSYDYSPTLNQRNESPQNQFVLPA